MSNPDWRSAGWLMPWCRPWFAATGASSSQHMAPGTGRQTMLYGCYAMFGLSLVASLIIISMIWNQTGVVRHVGHRAGADVVDRARSAGPTITVVGLLGTNAALAVGPKSPIPGGSRSSSGVPVWGFAVLWIALAATLTSDDAARRTVPCHPLSRGGTSPSGSGTFVTGTTQLALHTICPRSRYAAVTPTSGC